MAREDTNQGKGNTTRVWNTTSGAPSENWERVYPRTTSVDNFISDLEYGDLLLWLGQHTVF